MKSRAEKRSLEFEERLRRKEEEVCGHSDA